ncbi:right-handed parallel beta-helix repeat-containing protein, partial [bacterium]|nr:right-handed parallel beta-helix repeat-containing protein [bacterium]
SLLATFAFALLFAGSALAGNATLPGRLSSPYPTLTNLAVEWEIEGDANLNAVCNVEYRRSGEAVWHKSMSLVRVPADDTGERTWPIFRWTGKLAGSVFDLRPGTRYEIKLSLRDPDGGKADTVIAVSTRPVPAPAPDARVIQANPDNFGSLVACAEPGDVFVLTPGYYEETSLSRDGAPGRPIVIRGDGANPAIGSTFDGLDLQDRKHLIVERLTVWGGIDLRGAEDVAVRRCNVTSRHGIFADHQPGCKNCYIADNTVTWRMPWTAEGMGSSSPWGGAANEGEGIEITGPGNVICYNRVSGYRDCVSLMEDLWVYDQRCDDIYNNDISVGPDDGIEADFCSANCRIMRNRIANCGMGLSAQPSLGGPVYFIRNVMYNLAGAPFKLERHSVGSIFLHNTSLRVGDGFIAPHWQNEYFRTVWLNNLCLGGHQWDSRGRPDRNVGRAVFLPGFNSTCTFDYNAAGSCDTLFAGMVANDKFSDLAGLKRATRGPHSVRVGMGTFAAAVPFPDPPVPAREAPDLRLAPGSPALDAG